MLKGQFQNGVSEAMVKITKGVMKALLQSLGQTKLSLKELNTCLLEVANIVNERPIGIRPNLRSECDFLSPNCLLLGRSSQRIPARPFQPATAEDFSDKPSLLSDRFHLVQRIISQFWKNWIKLYFPTLLIRQKWHVEKRNMVPGDICILKDPETFRSEWILCKVEKVYPDASGLVRNVQIYMKPRIDGKPVYKPTKAVMLLRHVSSLIIANGKAPFILYTIAHVGVSMVER